MPLSIDTNCTLAVDDDCMMICTQLLSIKEQLGHVYGKCEWSVDNFGSCMYVNSQASSLLPFITHVLADISKRQRDMYTAQCWKWESTGKP